MGEKIILAWFREIFSPGNNWLIGLSLSLGSRSTPKMGNAKEIKHFCVSNEELLYSVIQYKAETQSNTITTSMNARTHFFIKLYLSHFILERVDVGCVWEMSWRRGQTAILIPSSSSTIAALLSHLGWVAQPWVPEGRKPSDRRWLSRWHPISN